MFSVLFGGRLGEFLAPRPNSKQEIWTFLKTGLFDKALRALSKPNHGFNVNEIDEATGMAPLHFASAAGKLDLMAELLGQGADIRIADKHGNNALHFAATNDQKTAIEILLRSGADPTVPNHDGMLPVELTESAVVKDLFNRDPTNIFSPMVQARALFHDYVVQLQESNRHHKHATEEQSVVQNLTRAFESSPPNAATLVADEAASSSGQPRTSPPAVAAPSSPSPAEAGEFIGVASPLPPSSVSRQQAQTADLARSAAPPPPPPPPITSPTQRLSFTGGSYAAHALLATTPAQQASRHPSFFTPTATNAVEPLEQAATPFDLDAGLDAAEMQTQLLHAARETANNVYLTSDERQVRFDIVKCCQRVASEQEVRRLLRYDPTLPMCRLSGLGQLCEDGQTPLHAAARFGNVAALKLFLELGSHVSLWVRDLQGRTPLHVAAASSDPKAHEAIAFLREEMKKERNRDPIGPNAPVDMAGMTPLGAAKLRIKGKVTAEMQKVLFSPGDRSVISYTPSDRRAGRSPWKAPLTLLDPPSKDNVVYAFSEAVGWTVNMEDRHAVSVPVPGRPAWSLFCVFDGHGGATCSQYLANHFVNIVAQLASEIDLPGGSPFVSSAADNDADTTPELLTDLLLRACIRADEDLASLPRMKVETKQGGKKLVCLDKSGSTAVVALLTAQYIAVANVGDSRAVMALRDMDNSTHSLVSSPFGSDGLSQPPSNSSSGRRLSNQCVLRAVAMSRDHKPSIPDERARIENAGATVRGGEAHHDGTMAALEVSTPRLEDVKLRMSRAFGDFFLKQNADLSAADQAVIAVPEIRVVARTPANAFLVLACDGVWDVLSNQEVVDFLAEKLGFTAYGGPVGGVTTNSAARACDELLTHCIELGSTDNLTVVLVMPGAPPTLPASQSTPDSQGHYPHYQSFRRSGSGSGWPSSGSPSFPASAPATASVSGRRSPRASFTGQANRPSIASTEIDLPTYSTHSLAYGVNDSLHHQPPMGGTPGSSSPPVSTPSRRATNLNGIFTSFEDDVSSPINTAAGFSRLRLENEFND